MKTTKIIFSFLMLFVINKASAQQITSAEMQVTGLTCSMCSQATEKSIRTLSYVADVKPDLNRNLFVITFKIYIFAIRAKCKYNATFCLNK